MNWATSEDAYKVKETAVRQEQSAQEKIDSDWGAYAEYEKILGSVKSGAIAPIRGSFVIKEFERVGRLSARQDLPEEAFWTYQELRQIVDAAKAHFKSSTVACKALGYLFAALSYR